jgi:hypothetical protein
MIYVRFRFGHLTVQVSDEPTDDINKALRGKVVHSSGEDSFDGMISYEEFTKRVTEIEWPDPHMLKYSYEI